MLVHVGLHVQRVLFGVQSARHVEGKRFVGAPAQVGGNLPDRDGVFVRHAVKALVLLRIRGKILNGAKVVADGQIAARLNAGKGDLTILKHNENTSDRMIF